MRSPFLLIGAFTSLAAVGCIQQSEDRPDAEAAATSATALVVVERTSGPGDTVRGDAVIARFVRVQDGRVDDQALRLAGAAFDLPAVGTCSATQEAQPVLQPRSISLLDVGVLTVDGANGKTVALPRSVPDPTGLVSGVFYSASARSTETFTASERLHLHTSGGPDVDSFAVNVAAPRDVADVRVTSLSSASGASGLDVQWEAAESDDARDVVYVDVIGASSHLVARCTTLDVGYLMVPGAALAALGAGDDAQLSVHRLHRESFRAKGIDSGEIRFDVARVISFRR